MIRSSIREARYFLYSQAFADGLRASFAIILPALTGAYFGYFDYGLTISLGAMCTSLTDAPGPVVHKRNGMLITAGLAFLTALLTALASRSVYVMAGTVAAVSFFYSMFSVYGNRATSVGNAALLIMILTMDTPAINNNVLLQAGLILAGCLFYFSLSMLLYFIRPYRNAQRALGDCIREVAAYLDLRAAFYDTRTDLQVCQQVADVDDDLFHHQLIRLMLQCLVHLCLDLPDFLIIIKAFCKSGIVLYGNAGTVKLMYNFLQ